MMSVQVNLFQTALRCRDRVNVDEIAVAKLKMHNPASPIFTALTSAGNDNPIATIPHVAVRERMVIMHDMMPPLGCGAQKILVTCSSCDYMFARFRGGGGHLPHQGRPHTTHTGFALADDDVKSRGF